jgi:hypothetical protein
MRTRPKRTQRVTHVQTCVDPLDPKLPELARKEEARMGTVAHPTEIETWHERVHDADERRVLEALSDRRWDFRTVAGLVRATRLPEQRVNEILEGSEFVR